ncbi:MAG: hypothetical protein PHV06_00490 [bacterium]|nr:hypothetical protein [bacterium]
MKFRTIYILSLSFLILIVTGCALNEDWLVRKAVKEYLNAVKTGDEKKWEELLTPESLDILYEIRSLENCPEKYKRLPSTPLLTWKIKKILLGMSTATIILELAEDGKEYYETEIELKKCSNEWKIDLEESFLIILKRYKGFDINLNSEVNSER